ncbi:MAG: plastocyanin/azurin family copper-binding protein, partial [Candidatus Thermoplasmatota archaeon]
MQGTRPLSRSTLALAIVVPLILGVIGGGVWGYMVRAPAQGTPVTGESVSFTLKAYLMPGFKGVGGSIDGQTNPDLRVNKGDSVTITLINGEVQTHDLYVEGFDVRSPAVTGVNATTSITFVASKEGTFAYYCAIPGHREMGMKGNLIVSSGQGGADGLPPIGPEKFPLDTQFIGRDPTDVPPPTNRTTPATVDIFLEAREVNAEVIDTTAGNMTYRASFTYWTYNGTVPGPMFRV